MPLSTTKSRGCQKAQYSWIIAVFTLANTNKNKPRILSDFRKYLMDFLETTFENGCDRVPKNGFQTSYSTIRCSQINNEADRSI